MFKVKSISILVISTILFVSCNDVTTGDKKRPQIVVNPKPINATVGETFTYEGDVTHGPAADIFYSFKAEHSENVESYNDWLSVKIIEDGDKYVLEGTPDLPGEYHFRFTVQREKDFNLDVGSYVTGLNITVTE